MDLSPSADGIASFGLQTCQDLLDYYDGLNDLDSFKNHNTDFEFMYRPCSEIRPRLTHLQLELEALDPGSADFASSCLTASLPGLIALSLALKHVQEDTLPEDLQLADRPERHKSLRKFVKMRLRCHITDVQHALNPPPTHTVPDRRLRRRIPHQDNWASDGEDALLARSRIETGNLGQHQAGNEDENSRLSQAYSATMVQRQLPAPHHLLLFLGRAQRIPLCYILALLGLIVIGGSLAVGVYYSVAKDRMGDGFTTAGWMTAAGTLILAAPMARHYPHCRCWGRSQTFVGNSLHMTSV